MSRSLGFLKIIGKIAYFIGVLLFFNFFFGLLFFRFIPWVVFGIILLILFSSTLSVGKNILFTSFGRKEAPRNTTYKRDDVIDVEAEVVENDRSEQ